MVLFLSPTVLHTGLLFSYVVSFFLLLLFVSRIAARDQRTGRSRKVHFSPHPSSMSNTPSTYFSNDYFLIQPPRR